MYTASLCVGLQAAHRTYTLNSQNPDKAHCSQGQTEIRAEATQDQVTKAKSALTLMEWEFSCVGN